MQNSIGVVNFTRPDEPLRIPHETYLPLCVALGIAVFFVGLLVSAVAVGAIGVAVAMVAIVWWAWRTEEVETELVEDEREKALA